MSKYDWTVAMAVAALGAIMLCSCVDYSKCAEYMYQHNEQAIKTVAEIARLTPEDSTTRPLVERVHWRLTDRQRPWATQFRRSQPEVRIDIPETMMDNRAMLDENRALDEFEAEITVAKELKAKLSDWSGMGGVIGVGGVLGTVLSMIGGRVLKDKKKWMLRARKALSAMNAMKAVSPEVKEVVVAHTSNDGVLKEAYEEEKAQLIRESREKRADVLRQFT